MRKMNATVQKRGPARKQQAVPLEDSSNSISIEGRQVPVSHLQKVFYPKIGFTKAQVIDYYLRIAPVLLPHLKDRPVTLKRYPNGVEGPFFYEKRCPAYRPEWVDIARVRRKQSEEEINFCVINNLASLVWAANLADLELHTSLARKQHIECPTMVVFDLDPGAPAGIIQCAEVALRLRAILERLKLKSFAKTSGSKGLQVHVPLNTNTNFGATKAFARKLAESLAGENPARVVSAMAKNLRKGKVLVDWSQNDTHKTTICVYSLRAREQPTVSTPVTWDEVEIASKDKDAEYLSFLPDQVLNRVAEFGDLFAPVLKLKQKLPAI
ncbi:MAG: primase-like protein [Pedosphaera sp.]|nr:primase-like protein [Pedosphaera sp.]